MGRDVRLFVKHYLDANKPEESLTEQVIEGRNAYRYNGEVCFFLSELRKFIRMVHREDYSTKKLGAILYQNGIKNRMIRYKRTTRTVWCIKLETLDTIACVPFNDEGDDVVIANPEEAIERTLLVTKNGEVFAVCNVEILKTLLERKARKLLCAKVEKTKAKALKQEELNAQRQLAKEVLRDFEESLNILPNEESSNGLQESSNGLQEVAAIDPERC